MFLPHDRRGGGEGGGGDRYDGVMLEQITVDVPVFKSGTNGVLLLSSKVTFCCGGVRGDSTFISTVTSTVLGKQVSTNEILIKIKASKQQNGTRVFVIQANYNFLCEVAKILNDLFCEKKIVFSVEKVS